MKRVGIYGRHSTNKQNAKSAEDQVKLCQTHAEQQGWDVVKTYRDEALSGSHRSKRPGVLQLLSDARQNKFDIVLIESLDRLGRNLKEVADIYEEFKYNDIKLIALQGGELSGLLVGVLGAVAESFLDDVRHKTWRGCKSKIEQKLSPGGLCYGYRVVKSSDQDWTGVAGEWAIIPEQADVIRRVFREYASGKSPLQIARGLNADGIPGPRRPRSKKNEMGIIIPPDQGEHSPWRVSSISGHACRGTGLLNNEMYVGILVWNRQSSRKSRESGNRIFRKNPEDQVDREAVPELRIVPEDLWQAVKKRQNTIRETLEKKKKELGRSAGHAETMNAVRRPTSFLSGRMVCGVCGGSVGLVLRGRWGCLGRHRGVICDNNRTIKREFVEERVLSGLTGPLVSEQALQEAVAAYRMEFAALRRRRRSQFESDHHALKAVNGKIQNVMNAIESGGDFPILTQRLGELAAAKKGLEERLEEVSADLPDVMPDFEQSYRQRVAGLAEVLADPALGQESTNALQALIEKVTFMPGAARGEVSLKLSGDLVGILAIASGKGAAELMTMSAAGPRNQTHPSDKTTKKPPQRVAFFVPEILRRKHIGNRRKGNRAQFCRRSHV